jgi:apolipoprotein N-acyltransferase
MRGVENGFAVLRSAFDGLETISDAQGRILARAPTEQVGMVAVSADVPLGPGPTPYTRIGDVFPWLCAVLSLLVCARLVARGSVAAAWLSVKPANAHSSRPSAG